MKTKLLILLLSALSLNASFDFRMEFTNKEHPHIFLSVDEGLYPTAEPTLIFINRFHNIDELKPVEALKIEVLIDSLILSQDSLIAQIPIKVTNVLNKPIFLMGMKDSVFIKDDFYGIVPFMYNTKDNKDVLTCKALNDTPFEIYDEYEKPYKKMGLVKPEKGYEYTDDEFYAIRKYLKERKLEHYVGKDTYLKDKVQFKSNEEKIIHPYIDFRFPFQGKPNKMFEYTKKKYYFRIGYTVEGIYYKAGFNLTSPDNQELLFSGTIVSNLVKLTILDK